MQTIQDMEIAMNILSEVFRFFTPTISKLTWAAAIMLVLGLIVGSLGHLVDYGTLDLGKLLDDFYANVSAELVSIAITVFVIDRLAWQRQGEQEKVQLLGDLIASVRSQNADTVAHAIEKLSERGWLYDGSLEGKDFSGANLQKASLYRDDKDVNFSECQMKEVNLRGVRLYGVNLQLAYLYKSNLQEAHLLKTNLQGANLGKVNFKDAYLLLADLEGASLLEADLQGAKLWDTNLADTTGLTDLKLVQADRLRGTKLPDRSRYNGKFRLPGDIADAKEDGIDVSNDEAMAEWYVVPLEDYQHGQEWATKHLLKLREAASLTSDS